MSIELHSQGAKRKLQNLRNMAVMFRDLPAHSAMFAQEQISSWELNHNPVNVVSGSLKGSPTVEIQPNAAIMRVNGNRQAPYAEKVRLLYIRTGRGDFMQMFRERVRPIIDKEIKDEFHRAAQVIDNGGIYTYKNPYYA